MCLNYGVGVGVGVGYWTSRLPNPDEKEPPTTPAGVVKGPFSKTSSITSLLTSSLTSSLLHLLLRYFHRNLLTRSNTTGIDQFAAVLIHANGSAGNRRHCALCNWRSCIQALRFDQDAIFV